MGNSCVTGAPPALLGKADSPTFKWKVYGFSALLERGAIRTCSSPFQCGGYKWFLEVTPSHNKSGDGNAYIALCLCLSRIDFNPGYIIDAVFELSMHNQSNGTYCGCKASYSFNVKKTHSEKLCLIPLEELLKSSSDFLIDDSCVFGVRILKAGLSSPQKKPVVVSKKPITEQKLFLQKKELIKGAYTWIMDNYLDLKHPVVSPAFEVGGHKWHINMHPLGDQYSTKSLSLYLHLHDPSKLPSELGMMIEVTLSIVDQEHEKHNIQQGRFSFAGKNGWGWSNFIPLKTLNDPSKGYLVGSKCIVKADITIIGSSNNG